MSDILRRLLRKIRVVVLMDFDWTTGKWENAVSLLYLASQMQVYLPAHTPENLREMLLQQLVLLMGNLHDKDAQAAEIKAVHDCFRDYIILHSGFMPPTAEWSHTARALLIMRRLGVQITPEIIDHMVQAESEMFEIVASENPLYEDVRETFGVLRQRFGAIIIVVTSSDTRTMLRPGQMPLFDPAHSTEQKIRRVGVQRLFDVVPETHFIVAEHGKRHEKTTEAIRNLIPHDDRKLFIVTVGDTSGDMHVPTPSSAIKLAPNMGIFVIRQRDKDGKYNLPPNAHHAVEQLAEIPELVERALRQMDT